MPHGRRSAVSREAAWKRYGGALAMFAVAFALTVWLSPLLKDAAFSVFLAAMVVVAGFGGLGPCLMVQVLTIAVALLLSEPEQAPEPDSPLQIWTGLAAFFFVGIVAAVLGDSMRAARRRARAEAAEAVSQREQLRTTLACIGDGVLVTDDSGRITMMNPVAEALTGWPASASVGRTLGDVFSIRDEQTGEPASSPTDRVRREGPVVHCDRPLVLVTRGGRQLPIDYSAAPVQDANDRPRGIVLIFRDETGRRQAEQELREADRRKDEFLATLAHELRNPLAPIRTGLELLKLSGHEPAMRDSVLATMERQTAQMVRLIDDLLDVSRITRGKLQLRRSNVELADVLGSAVDATRPLVVEAGHELAVELPDEPIVLDADPHRLAQVFANLLNNAARYTPAGGQITLSAARHGDDVQVAVRDTGIGIPPEMRDRIFDMFTQVERPAETPHTGLGIGLTLVKSLVEMHGGSVEVQSDGTGRGSEFRVRLPIAKVAPASATPVMPEERANGELVRRRVLVVDDNAAARDMLTLMLEMIGHEVRAAQDGSEAITCADEFRPDVVLMDLGMPNVDGYAAAREIRTRSWGGEVLLVATTGWGQEDDRRRSREAGFDHHLVKPVDSNVLRRILNEMERVSASAIPA